MINLKYLPVHFSLFLIIGIFLGYEYDFPIGLLFLVAFIAFLFLIFFYYRTKNSFKPPTCFVLFTGILFLTIGILNISLQKPKNQKKHYSKFISSENLSVIKILTVLKPTDYYLRYTADVVQVSNNSTKGKVLLKIVKSSLAKALNVDDLILTKNEFLEINTALNPFEFNYREYLKKQNIHHQIILSVTDFIRKNASRRSLRGFAYVIRKRIDQKLENQNLSKEVIAIFNALLLGQRQGISKELFENYKNAGAIHILAVSGLHIGIILLILNYLFKPLEILKGGKTIKLILLIGSLWTYAMIAGLSASVIRAVTMFTAISIGLVINRPSGIKNSLVVSLFILLMINPLYLFNVGFQLSYTAVFSIVWIQPLFIKVWNPKQYFIKYFWQLLSVSFAAQIGILPLSLYYFHQFPGLFFISSLVIIPFLGLILGIGILIIILGLTDLLPQILTNLYSIVIKSMNEFVAIISRQESFIFQNIPFSFLLLILVYTLLISSVDWIKNKTANSLICVLIAILLLQSGHLYEKWKIQKTNKFIVFHQRGNSFFGNRQGERMKVYQDMNNLTPWQKSILTSFVCGSPNLGEIQRLPIKNGLKIGSQNIIIIDSSGTYKDTFFMSDTIILIQSPKINLNRLIQNMQPKMIIADGSNYKTYIDYWDRSCKNKSVKFYATNENGAFQYHY